MTAVLELREVSKVYGTGAAEVDALRDELRDRFGPLPEPVERLLELVRLRSALVAVANLPVSFRVTGASLSWVFTM